MNKKLTPASFNDSEALVYEPVWEGTPEDYLKKQDDKKASGEDSAENELPTTKIDGMLLTADDGTQIVTVTRFERDTGSKTPRAVIKRGYYAMKNTLFWIGGVLAVTFIVNAIYSAVS